MRGTWPRSVVASALLVAVFAVMASHAVKRLDNYDTYFHLRFGHEFLTGSWSLRDPGTVTSSATADWVPTQWLPQVVMAQVEEWVGLAGVAWLSGLLFLTLAVAAYWACRRRAEPLVAAFLVALTFIACTPGLSMRPQLLSYLFVVATTAAWLRARDTGRPPYLLVPLTWLWAVSHGMWPIGIVIGLVAVAGIAADRRHPARLVGRMLLVPAAQVVVSLLTPSGFGLFPAVLLVNSRADYFSEWASPDFTEPYAVAVLLLLALALIPRLRAAERAPWTEVLLVGLAALWALYSVRTVPVAACMAAVLAAPALQGVVGRRPEVTRPERAVVWGAYAAVLGVTAVLVPHTADEPIAAPGWLAETFDDAPAGTTVLTEASYGAYLMWRFPQLDVPLNGYGDLYTDAELDAKADLLAGSPGWVELARRTGATYAAVPPGSTLGYNLRELEGWRVLEHDDELELLAPPPGWTDAS